MFEHEDGRVSGSIDRTRVAELLAHTDDDELKVYYRDLLGESEEGLAADRPDDADKKDAEARKAEAKQAEAAKAEAKKAEQDDAERQQAQADQQKADQAKADQQQAPKPAASKGGKA